MRTSARFLLPALVLMAIGTLTLAPDAFAGFWSPEHGGSPNADKINTLYWILFVLGILVFLGVEGTLVYSLFKFRARKGAVPAQIRGNTRLEIGWTVGAALILVVIAVVTFTQLNGIRTAPTTDTAQLAGLQLPNYSKPGETGTPDDRAFPKDGKGLRIQVTGQQYIWRFTYLDGDDNNLNNVFSYETLVVPAGVTVTLLIKAQDVAHSWWIPELGGKFDAIPGHTNYTWFKIPASKAGTTFRGQCAELCGRNHANMTAHVKAVTPQQFAAFLQRKKNDIAAANKAAAQQRRVIEGQGQ